MMIDGLHRRMAHLLTLTPPRRRFGLWLLAIVLPETDIHITLHIGDVLQNILDDPLLDGPTEEIQLAHRGLLNRCLATNLEADSFAAAKGIKESLRIGLEFALVMEMHHELALLMQIRYAEFLGVVCHEPVDESQTDGARTSQNRQYLFKSPRLIVEVLEPANNEILLALDTILECLTRGVHSFAEFYVVGLDGHRDSAVLVEEWQMRIWTQLWLLV